MEGKNAFPIKSSNLIWRDANETAYQSMEIAYEDSRFKTVINEHSTPVSFRGWVEFSGISSQKIRRCSFQSVSGLSVRYQETKNGRRGETRFGHTAGKDKIPKLGAQARDVTDSNVIDWCRDVP